MSRLIMIVCCLLALLAVPIWLLMAAFSPALLTARVDVTKMQILLVGALATVFFIGVPVWVAYFGRRTLRGWREGAVGSALLMALPALVLITLMVFINVYS